uniref:hypothetical protein n=1 Tax=Escherichia coli TaxID=562 RepID=UPI0015EE675F|nr:hypothetical protein [Escherichia coli]
MPELLLQHVLIDEVSRLLNTIDLSQADFSPMRSSFVNHDCPSLLSTVIVSLLRSICLPALRSTVITRFITTMADSDFRKFVFAALCLALVPQIPCSCGKFPDLLCSVTYLCKLADACAPVVGFLWHIASVASGNLLPAS